MQKSNQYIIDFYNHYDEDNRLALKHGMVEFLTTMHYIKKYLKKGDKILEIGAGTGRYSHALAREGYSVDAVELVEHNIEIFKQNTTSEERVSVIRGNALELSTFSDNQYDITLLLGPLYHLYCKEDKQQAIREAIDAMDSETFELYMQYHLTTCEREDMLGFSSHVVDVFQKQESILK